MPSAGSGRIPGGPRLRGQQTQERTDTAKHGVGGRAASAIGKAFPAEGMPPRGCGGEQESPWSQVGNRMREGPRGHRLPQAPGLWAEARASG